MKPIRPKRAATQKPPILLLHGALGSAQQFSQVKLILSKQFEVLDLDFEGHGTASSEKEYSISLFTENVLAFLDQKSIKKIDLFGYSMGGYVALNTALKAPHRIGKISTYGTKFNWDSVSTEKEVSLLDPQKMEEKVPHFVEKLKTEHPSQNWEDVVLKTARMMMELSNGKMLTDEELRSISNEVRIGWGTEDKMVSREESEKVAALLPNGELKVLLGMPHPLEKMDPNDLATFLLNM